MELIEPIFNKQRSNLQARRICVRVGSYQFPKCCILCGSEHEVSPVPVEFKAVLLLGVLAGGETTTLSFPLCKACSDGYTTRAQRWNAIMTACFLLGFGGAMLLALINDIAPRAFKNVPEIVGIAVGGLAVLLIVASFVMLLMKNRLFPIKLKHRGWILRDDEHHVFYFPDNESMYRFINANTSSSAGEQAPAPETSQSFGAMH